MMRGFRFAFAGLLLIQTMFFGDIIFLGKVIYPHNNDVELTGQSLATDHIRSNRKFCDQSAAYVPEIALHLNGKPASWLSTWNPHNQLGRPAIHASGFSKAFLISHIVSIYVSDPFVFYTVLTVITVFLSGIFCFGFLESSGLDPVACLVASLGLSCGVLPSYWLTFVMFVSPVCWCVFLLWMIKLFFQRMSLAAGVGISFGVYSLLMTAYPQAIVGVAYILVIYGLMTLAPSDRTRVEKWKATGLLVIFGCLGVLGALPLYLDLAHKAAESSRFAAGHDFFLAVLPRIHTFGDLYHFMVLCYDAFLYGNPMSAPYPFEFNGLSLTPLYSSLVALSCVDGMWRRLWPWQAFIAVCLVCTVWAPGYLFLVDYMGFRFSRYLPLALAVVPAFILAAHSAHHLICRGMSRPFLAGAIIMLPVMAMTANLLNPRAEVSPFYAACAMLIVACLALAILSNRFTRTILVGTAILSAFTYGYQLRLVRPVDSILQSSRLTQALKCESGGARYASVGVDMSGVIPPNHEIAQGLYSPFSYDSLSSKIYQNIVLGFSEKGTQTYGRWFGYLESDSGIDSEAFSFSGVNALISRKPLQSSKFMKTDAIDGIFIYRRKTPALMMAQLTDFQERDDQVNISGSLDDQRTLPLERVRVLDDYMRLRLSAHHGNSLVFLSEQHHPWRRAWSGNRQLRVVRVNGFYTGVIIPPGVSDVEFGFEPYIVWSWIPQLFFVALAVVIGAGRLRATFFLLRKQDAH